MASDLPAGSCSLGALATMTIRQQVVPHLLAVACPGLSWKGAAAPTSLS